MRRINFSEMKQFSQKTLPTERITTNRYTSKTIDDKEKIKSIIKSMINIQAILAHHYSMKRDFGITELTGSTSWFITENIYEEIDLFTFVFKNVFVNTTSDGKPISIQADYAKESAYEAFAEILEEDQIDKYIKHLSVEKTFKDDFRSSAYFEIEKHDISIVKSVYFDHLIEATKAPEMIGQLFIDVSGFKIDEIEQDEFVQQFASRVKHLYLMVYDNEIIENKVHYRKFLTWCL
ncbi:hypothetical protein SAMN05216378_3334 [Paenibacillus catalpae]|uniref:Uncharacterized protein n=1 Tax=Paenibacillus catalpae TaxID=1045775 RepID=A0A1I2B153_9BACL|nr:hypothetical protein [Paenibacillus catalpae]SFE49921.1 hypothetical protein SAMN05216378_3334 [Paenibacillus catalpae]